MAQVSVFQTIQTKYISPTNFKGTRIKAKSASGITIMRGYDYSLNVAGNHAQVATELQSKLGWTGKGYGDLIGGQNADGSYTWILSGDLIELTSSVPSCAVCGVSASRHGHYSATDRNTHKCVSK